MTRMIDRLLLSLSCLGVAAGMAAASEPSAVFGDLGRQSFWFEENLGQFDDGERFVSRGQGFRLSLQENGAVLELGASEQEPAATFALELLGALPDPSLRGEHALPGRVNSFIGNDPERWTTGGLRYGRVRYQGVYPGIDLLFYKAERRFEFDFVVQPGGDTQLIRLDFGPADVRIEEDGALAVVSNGRTLRLNPPRLYQDDGNKRVDVPGEFLKGADGAVSFRVGPYDSALPLVIDPVISFSTYLGGSGYERLEGMVVDDAGAVYLVGKTTSLDLPTGSAAQPFHTSGFHSPSWHGTEAALVAKTEDAFVAKVDPVSSELVFLTYLGGPSDADEAHGVALDSSGQIYVVGWTASVGFPQVGVDTERTVSILDAFVAKLGPTGELLLAAPFGGWHIDIGSQVEIGPDGSVYMGGTTASSDFPAIPLPSLPAGSFSPSMFVMRATSDLSDFDFSVLFGSGSDEMNGLVVDPAGYSYLVGRTSSLDFPTVNALQTEYAGGDPPSDFGDAYVAKLSPSGQELVFSTYLGGSLRDTATSVDLDGSGNVYIAAIPTRETSPSRTRSKPNLAVRTTLF